MKLFYISLFCLSSFCTHAVTLDDDIRGECKPIVAQLKSFLSKNGESYIQYVTLGDRFGREKLSLSYSQKTALNRSWLRYEDIDNDQKKELFLEWMSYQSTYADNRSSIYVFEYPKEKDLEDIFSKGEYKSEFFPEFESWMISNFQWESYSGPVGAKNALPSSLQLTDTEIWHAGKGFGEPSNDYSLKVFSASGMQYVLVRGRHDKQGRGYVVRLTDIEAQKFETICKLSGL